MQSLSDRIRRARALSNMSQQALANAVDVKRSSVAQWERNEGSSPSMQHLLAIAIATGVCLEWLGTGRGPVTPQVDAWASAVQRDLYAQDDLETECLGALRRIPFSMRQSLVLIIQRVAGSY